MRYFPFPKEDQYLPPPKQKQSLLDYLIRYYAINRFMKAMKKIKTYIVVCALVCVPLFGYGAKELPEKVSATDRKKGVTVFAMPVIKDDSVPESPVVVKVTRHLEKDE